MTRSIIPGKFPLSVTQYPSGRWGFAGSIPVALAFESIEGGPPDPEQVKIASHCGPGFAKRIRSRAWNTREEAMAAASELGFEVAA